MTVKEGEVITSRVRKSISHYDFEGKDVLKYNL